MILILENVKPAILSFVIYNPVHVGQPQPKQVNSLLLQAAPLTLYLSFLRKGNMCQEVFDLFDHALYHSENQTSVVMAGSLQSRAVHIWIKGKGKLVKNYQNALAVTLFSCILLFTCPSH